MPLRGSRRFQFRFIPFVAAVVVAAIGLSLGNWQMRRAHQKHEIAERLEVRKQLPAVPFEQLPGQIEQAEFRTVSLIGRFVTEWPLYLDNRPLNGQVGRYVMMPFRLASNGQVVLVQRGWVVRDAQDRTRLPVLVTPDAELVLTGRVLADVGHVLQLGQDEALHPNAIVQNLNLPQLAQASRMKFAPYVVAQTSDDGDHLVRDWPQAGSGEDRHLGYAFQWYALAATSLLFFVVTGFKRGKQKV